MIRITKTEKERRFSPDDEIMLQSIADHLGQIIQAAKLRVLGRHFDRNVCDMLLRDPSLLSVKLRRVTICFWDIRGFTRMCDTLKAERFLIKGFIQQYYNLAARTILDGGGVLDKFIGDGVMGLFGVPQERDSEEEVAKAARAAVRVADALRVEFDRLVWEWKEKWRKDAGVEIEIGLGCGIHTAKDVLVGIFETEVRDQYTCVGPDVNLASRIEKEATGGQILISSATAVRVKTEFRLSEAGSIGGEGEIKGIFRLSEVVPERRRSSRS